MELTTSHIQFIKEHATDDLTRLLLSAAKYPGMDIPFLVDQIAVRRQIREDVYKRQKEHHAIGRHALWLLLSR